MTSATLQSTLQAALAVKVYHGPSVKVASGQHSVFLLPDADLPTVINCLGMSFPGICLTAVPVLSIHDRDGTAAAVALDVNSA
jgi:hypothetical protein